MDGDHEARAAGDQRPVVAQVHEIDPARGPRRAHLLVEDALRLAPALVAGIAIEDQVVVRAEGVRQGPGQAAHDGHDPARVGLVDGHEDAHRAGT